MDSSFVNQLLDFLLSPIGLLGSLSGLFFVFQAQRSRPLAWLLFSLCCFCASLAKHYSNYVLEPPALVFPLQQIRDLGRPLTIVILGLLILLTLSTKLSWRRHVVAEPIKLLIIVQVVIFLKALAEGNVIFALLAALTFGSVVYMLISGPSHWLSDDQNFRYAVYAVAGVSLLFVLVNLYQAAFDLRPITFLHGRLLGTTANPQHAAVLFAATIPCYMFLIETAAKNWQRFLGIACLCAVSVGLFMTGSRTGMLMAVTTVLFFYRSRSSALIKLGLTIAILVGVTLFVAGPDGFTLGGNEAKVAARFASTSNSREVVWSAMWQAFTHHPLFGVPLRNDRVGFGESSWLGAGATLGLVGLIPMALFGVSCLRMILKLIAIGQKQPPYYFQCSTVVSGLACLLVGSFFEAFLLGNLSFSLIATLTYLCLGQYLLERYKVQSKQAAQIDCRPHTSLLP